jgi:acetyltransferase-like isoleucine patch superfamily enzyme
VGKYLLENYSLSILDTSLVILGDRIQMGPNVGIYTAGHETSVLSRRKYIEFGHPVRIGDDCWIGGNVVILPGVTIGEGCTIGAGSVVTKDIPPFSVAVGSPCKVIKTIQSAEEEEQDPENPYRAMEREL